MNPNNEDDVIDGEEDGIPTTIEAPEVPPVQNEALNVGDVLLESNPVEDLSNEIVENYTNALISESEQASSERYVVCLLLNNYSNSQKICFL